jgi:hypothetical protein
MLFQLIITQTLHEWHFYILSTDIHIIIQISQNCKLISYFNQKRFFDSIPSCFLRSNLCQNLRCSLFTDSLCLTFATTRQWSISQSAPLKYGHQLYLDVVLSVSRRDQSDYSFAQHEILSVFINAVWKHCTLANYIFNVAKFTTLTPLSLLISCRSSLPTDYLKIFSLPTFALKSRNKILTLYSSNWSNQRSSSS